MNKDTKTQLDPILPIKPIRVYNDYWGDPNSLTTGNFNGLYYYFLNGKLARKFVESYDEGIKRKVCIFPPVDAINSIIINPYLKDEDFLIAPVEFDEERMPLPTSKPEKPSFNIPAYMWRIQNQKKSRKYVGTIKRFKTKDEMMREISTPLSMFPKRNWRYESKLQGFPYTYGVLYDNVAEPIQFKYEYIRSNKITGDVYVNVPLTNMGAYSFYIASYKGDNTGIFEKQMCSKTLNIPIISNTYMNYMSQNQAQVKTQIITTGLNAATSAVGSGINAFASAKTGDVGGAVSSGVQGVQNVVNAGGQIAGVMAKKKDLQTTPNGSKNAVNDTMYTLKTSSGYLMHTRYRISNQMLKKIGDFFALYGYKQNRVMSMDYRNRHFYNYIKTVGVNLNTNSIPKEHVQVLQNIFDKGVTVWHIDRPGVQVGDYQYDNFEEY